MLQAIGPSATTVTAAEAIQRRRERVIVIEAQARAQADLRAIFAQQAAVVQFGSEALRLAGDAATEASFGAAPLADHQRVALPPETPLPGQEPNPHDQREIRTLERTERQVLADARAERAAAGGHASGVHLTYDTGPNGRRYAVAAEVSLDVTPVPGDPAATLRKMEAILSAATHSSLSLSERHAAADAEELARRARAQLAAERYAEAQGF